MTCAQLSNALKIRFLDGPDAHWLSMPANRNVPAAGMRSVSDHRGHHGTIEPAQAMIGRFEEKRTLPIRFTARDTTERW